MQGRQIHLKTQAANAIEQGTQNKDRPTRQLSVTSDLCSHFFTVSGVHAPAVLEILSVSFLSFQGAVGVQYIELGG